MDWGLSFTVCTPLNFESVFGFHLFNHVNVLRSDWCWCWFCRNKNSVLFFVITGFVWQKCVTTKVLYSGFLNFIFFINAVKVSGRYLYEMMLSNPSWFHPGSSSTSQPPSLCHFRFRHCLTLTRFYGNFQLRCQQKQ